MRSLGWVFNRHTRAPPPHPHLVDRRVAVALGVGKTDHARRMCDQALVKLPCSAALWQLRLGLATDAAERERTAWRAAQQSVFVR